MNKAKDFYGLILAGGKSTRMGNDKSNIPYHNKPQTEFLNDLLRLFCERVFISRRKGQAVSDKLDPLFDQFDLDSPLNGILSAFYKFPNQRWITVPVDMPNVDTKALEFLIAHRDPTRAATCFYDNEGKLPDPLFAIWEKRSASLLMDYYKAGGFSPREFLIKNNARLLTSPDAKTLININTEERLKAWKDRLL